MKKTILTDCDGVVLNWEYAFNIWMEEHGFQQVEDGELLYNIGDRYNISKKQSSKLIRMFNESAAIGFLPPLRDAIEYVTRLVDEGYCFIAITSLSTNKYAQKLRKRNLEKLFGKNAFVSVQCLATGADKDQALDKYRDSGLYWIEDKVENALVGHKLGLKSIIMEHGFNMNTKLPLGVKRFANWKQIYKHIKENEK